MFVPALHGGRPLCRTCQFERTNDVDLATYEEAYRKGRSNGYERGCRITLENTLGSLPLKDLICLCHPDRHPPERQTLANEITAWLNGLRDSVPQETTV